MDIDDYIQFQIYSGNVNCSRSARFTVILRDGQALVLVRSRIPALRLCRLPPPAGGLQAIPRSSVIKESGSRVDSHSVSLLVTVYNEDSAGDSVVESAGAVKNQTAVFPQLLGPSVYTSHNAGGCWTFIKHNFSSTPAESAKAGLFNPART
jgi:hypothetical protein